jgi:hypothetical protein
MTGESLDAETQAFLFDATRLKRFRDRLRRGPRRTVRQEVVWTAFAAVYDDLPSGPERRKWLMAVLEELARRGDILLPVKHGSRWDKTSEIALPTAISLVAPQPGIDLRSQWRQFPWHPRLQWVFQLRSLSPDHFAFLQRVNEGLVEGWFEEPECFKYRSLQLTGDEKRLESLLKGTLFGPGCLTLEMLGCLPEALPLAIEQLSSRPSMLVFENAAPFMLARSIAARTQPLVGRLAWGAGTQILKAVAYFPLIQPAVTEILYVGDLDAAGMKIAADLQRTSKAVPVRPATQFHCAMLESAAQLGAEDGWPVKDEQPRSVSDTVTNFLAPEVRHKVSTLIAQGRRIPEEVLSHSAMARLLHGETGGFLDTTSGGGSPLDVQTKLEADRCADSR